MCVHKTKKNINKNIEWGFGWYGLLRKHMCRISSTIWPVNVSRATFIALLWPLPQYFTSSPGECMVSFCTHRYLSVLRMSVRALPENKGKKHVGVHVRWMLLGCCRCFYDYYAPKLVNVNAPFIHPDGSPRPSIRKQKTTWLRRG